MKIIPAVDILEGKVVRLFKGSFQEKIEYGDNPVSTAKFWQDKGAEFLHVVDLDGAKSGQPKNAKIIEDIIKSVSIPVEIGGGIRTIKDVEMYIGFGAQRVILGTIALHYLPFLDKKEIRDNVDKIAVSLDFRRHDDGSSEIMMAGTGGWGQEMPVFDYRGLLDRIFSSNIKYINYTDRLKDGTMYGLSADDISALEILLKEVGDRELKVIYAGGISSLEDIKNIARLKHKALEGVIVGKALYEGKFDLDAAQKEAGKH
jgi:phosphoribosylformimino-5-aminoimidazole carboxamide ribotide isomerase